MNAGILPLLMICAALGFALYATPVREVWPALIILCGSAFLVSSFPTGSDYASEPAFLGLWGATAILAGLVHLRGGLQSPFSWAAALVAGVCAGMVARSSGGPMHVLLATPLALLFLPAGWVLRRGYGVAIKVMSSWLIAISLLAAMVSLTPTPGYKPDHME